MIIRLCAFSDEAGSGIEEQIKALKENNIALTEVRNINGKNVSKFTEDEAKEYAAKFSAAGIGVWSLGSPLCKVHISTPLIKEYKTAKALCKTAKIMGTDNIRAFSYRTWFVPGAEKAVMKKVAVIRNAVEEEGINFCHENDTSFFGATAPNLYKLTKKFPGMKLVYDPANFIISGQDPKKTIEMFADDAYYFHIKDASGKMVVPAGFGDGMLRELIMRLDRDTVFTLEPHLAIFRGCSGLDKNEFDLSSRRGKFDCAVTCLRRLLTECGFEDKGTYFEKTGGKDA